MKLNIQWKKVLYGIALIVISIILAALHFIVAGKGIVNTSCVFLIQKKCRLQRHL